MGFCLKKQKTTSFLASWFTTQAVLNPTFFHSAKLKKLKVFQMLILGSEWNHNYGSTGLKNTLGHYKPLFNGKVNLKCLDNPVDIVYIYLHTWRERSM